MGQFIPLTRRGFMMNGVLTNGTTAGVWMNGMMTGILLDGMKVVNKRTTHPQAHFREMGENEPGLKSCSEHIPIELRSRRSRRWKILSDCQW